MVGNLRGAVFGCGMISEYHLRAWARIPEVEIVALGDQNQNRAEERRDQFAPTAKVYEDLATLLINESLDFIDILTPPELHRQHCMQAFDAGLDVICQKPIAPSVDEARQMITAAEQNDCAFSIHENHRYRPWFQQVLGRARDGFFGELRYARFEQFDAKEPPETYKLESQRGVLLEYGTHVIDMVHALKGAPSSVSGTAHRFNPRVAGESLVHVALMYPGMTACIDIAWKPTGLPQGSVLIVGDRGEAIYEGSMTRSETSRFRLIEQGREVIDETRSPYDDYIDSFYFFQRDVVQSWIHRKTAPQAASENLAVLETTIAAYNAIDSGQPVSVRPTSNET